ncbi:MAG: hypothetical protein IJ806_12170 [Ruminococcus sp.]|nr:hypothetical protein [Ruminococcus sp.]
MISKKDILDNGIPYISDLPENVEVTTRTGSSVSVQFIFNNSEDEQNIRLNSGDIGLQPFEMEYVQTIKGE